MVRMTLAFLFVLAWPSLDAQMVLHYTETSGWNHQTRAASLALFQDLAQEMGFTVVDDQDGSSFDDPAQLQQFAVVVFSNTSGDAILSPAQRANFEAYINDGGSLLGIHAASDTYRHSTANGNNTGTWDFYAELLGASVQENPNHVSGTPQYAMQHIAPHMTTAGLPDPWVKHEEYYYWENGYYRADNVVLLEVEETVGPNNMVNSYDAPRPMSWYRGTPQGGRVFYTALGHSPANFTADSLFRKHIRAALLWTADPATALPGMNEGRARFSITRSGGRMIVQGPVGRYAWSMTDLAGRALAAGELTIAAGGASAPLPRQEHGTRAVVFRIGNEGYMQSRLLMLGP